MTALDPSDPPLRKSAQRLRWFLGAFEEQVSRTEDETGNRYDVDRATLAEVFAEWLSAFQAQKPERVEDKSAYVGFAAGLMLRTLVRRKPAQVSSTPSKADPNNPAFVWPEGYLYVAFCLNVRGLVMAQDFQGEQHLSDALGDSRTWWSFKENVAEDPGLAIAFLDLFAGEDPNWEMPEMFRTGEAARLAGRFYQAKLSKL